MSSEAGRRRDTGGRMPGRGGWYSAQSIAHPVPGRAKARGLAKGLARGSALGPVLDWEARFRTPAPEATSSRRRPRNLGRLLPPRKRQESRQQRPPRGHGVVWGGAVARRGSLRSKATLRSRTSVAFFASCGRDSRTSPRKKFLKPRQRSECTAWRARRGAGWSSKSPGRSANLAALRAPADPPSFRRAGLPHSRGAASFSLDQHGNDCKER